MTFFSISHLAANEREFVAEIAATDAGLSPLVDDMLASHREPPPGVLIGNTDLTCEYVPYSGPRERAPLPGEEHKSALKSRTWRDA